MIVKQPIRAALLLSALIPSALLAGGRPLSLEEAYRLTLKQSETLAEKASAAEEARARVDELASAVKPSVALKASELFQERAANGVSNAAKNVPQSQVALHQPLFSGLREFAGIKAARAASQATDADLKRAGQLLYLDAAQAFFNLARLRKDAASRDAVLALVRDRMREIKDRERLGRSRKSEGLSVEALVADLEAQRAEQGREERDAQRALRFLTGLTEELAPVVPEGLPATPSLEEALRRAADRPDVAARALDVTFARQSLSAARREAWPTINLDGNRYLRRVGSQKDIGWDVLVAGELPLFRGGAWTARKAQARARLDAATAAHALALRRADLEVRAAHDRLTTQLDVLPARERALNLADANSQAQTADYRLGLVNNLDVLNSLENLQAERLQMEEARLEARVAAAALAVAAGDLP